MSAKTFLIVVIYADGSRSTPFQIPTDGRGRGWDAAIRYVSDAMDRSASVQGLVVVEPCGHVAHYTASDARDILGLN